MTTTDERERMCRDQLPTPRHRRSRVLAAFARRAARRVRRPADLERWAYDDAPLPIGFGQTISQPYVVAMTVQALGLDGHERVLEIGTGSGYAAAILGAMAREVDTVERISELARIAARAARALGYRQRPRPPRRRHARLAAERAVRSDRRRRRRTAPPPSLLDQLDDRRPPRDAARRRLEPAPRADHARERRRSSSRRTSATCGSCRSSAPKAGLPRRAQLG